MDFYSAFKKIIGLKSPRLKLALLAMARISGMRFAGVFIDPVMACNIRCRMCYFSDPAKRPKPVGSISGAALDALERNVLRRAMKMQIGCGAEPTLYRDLPGLIARGRRAGVPYIEITTNGQLLTRESLDAMIAAGLGGMTLSLHGTTRETFEFLMQGARFDRLTELIDTLRDVKSRNPGFKLRINYTVNNLNKAELKGLWQLFDGVKIDVLQVRPIQCLGDTAYSDFVIDDYDGFMSGIIGPVADECRRQATVALLPSRENVEHVDKKTSALNALLEEVSYIYVSPTVCYREDFDAGHETLGRYQRRSGIARRLRRAIFSRRLRAETSPVDTTKKLNYN